jgi:hypothetical protein
MRSICSFRENTIDKPSKFSMGSIPFGANCVTCSSLVLLTIRYCKEKKFVSVTNWSEIGSIWTEINTSNSSTVTFAYSYLRKSFCFININFTIVRTNCKQFSVSTRFNYFNPLIRCLYFNHFSINFFRSYSNWSIISSNNSYSCYISNANSSGSLRFSLFT